MLDDNECPLCLEKLEQDDLEFFPCTCNYQVCRFCWHRLRTDENGICPGCRKPYAENPVKFQPRKLKMEPRKQLVKKKSPRPKSRDHLVEFRILQRNLVYVVGLPDGFANANLLKKKEYFGQYGKILKLIIGSLPRNFGSIGGRLNTAYITYSHVEEAVRAICGTTNLIVNGHYVKTTLGTTKYCSNYINYKPCTRPECLYMHEVAPPELSFTKEDMAANKHIEYEQQLIQKLYGNDLKPKPQSLLELKFEDVDFSFEESSPEPEEAPMLSLYDSMKIVLDAMIKEEPDIVPPKASDVFELPPGFVYPI